MNEELGQASFKITADISGLESQLNKAKASLNSVKKSTDMGGLKITTDGFTGTASEYQKWYESQKNVDYSALAAEQEKAANALIEEARASRELYEERQRLIEVTNQQAMAEKEAAGASGGFARVMDNLKTSAGNAKDYLVGSFEGAKDAIEDLGYRGRAILIGLGTAVTAFAVSSIKEFAKYDQAFADSQESADKALSRLKAGFGQVLAPIAQASYAILDWASNNRELTTGIITFVGILGGGAGLLALLSKLKTALATVGFLSKSLLGVVSVVAAIGAGILASNYSATDFNETLEDAKNRENDLKTATERLTEAQNTYNGTLADVADEIAEINREREKSFKEYQQNLKQIQVDHQSTIDELTQQILDANYDYNKAIEERNAEFAVSQAKEEKEHQKKVDELMAQLNFLQRYNNKYNQEKLAQVEFALAKENRLYQAQTKAEQEELDLRNEQDKKARDEKLAKYQAELDEELAFMDKHRQDLNAVRDVILLDEIEKLNQQYEEQQRSYDKQIALANQKGAAAAESWADAYADYLNTNKSIEEAMGNLGKRSSKNWFESMSESGNEFLKSDQSIFGDLWRMLDEGFYQGFTRLQGYDTGGFTGRGGVNEVAGVVHRGEYVIPADSVDQNTGKPKLGNTTININVSGTFATSAQERRKVAEQIAQALTQTNNARSLA